MLLAFLASMLTTVPQAAGPLGLREQPVPARAVVLAAEGYVYGFPLLLMNETRQEATKVPYACGLGGPVNQFTHKFEVPDPEFRAVVRPNVDTLYSSAFLDLSEGPMVLEVPEVKDRFYLMAMLDAWSNNFAGPGTQTNAGEARAYLITAPGWNGELPAGMERIAAPTDLVWIIGRTELKGPDDLKAANAVQRAFQLYPQHGQAPRRSDEPCRSVAGQVSPEDAVKALSGEEFFRRLDRLIAAYPPPADNARLLRRLGMIGVGPQAQIEVDQLSGPNIEALQRGAQRGQQAIDKAFELGSRTAWTPDPEQIPLGDYGSNYLVRAVVSQIGFGANRNELATYQNADKDGDGRSLDGAKATYELRFPKGALPPVQAFWSVTVYDEDGFLVSNPIERYALGSNSGLAADENGDVTIVFATERPADVVESNWLPAPAGPFEVTLRMYAPEQPILDGSWSVPAITRR